jgi:hypothetical protein
MTTGSRKQNNGFADRSQWDDEILERVKKPVETAPKTRFRAKVTGSNPASPTNPFRILLILDS